MRNEFTAVFEHDGDWVVAYCPEVPGANGQGRTKDEARDSLGKAIALILEDRCYEVVPVHAQLEGMGEVTPTQILRTVRR